MPEELKSECIAKSVALRNVSKSFEGHPAVLPLSLEIAAGEMVALLGPSGCGKTTILRIIAGFERPDTGGVEIGGRDVTALAPNHRRLGMVFQNYSLFPHMSVGDNVAYGLRMMKVPLAERQTRVGEALRMIRLDGFEERFPRQLSGGQQQRVALARSLVTRPSVLLLDEPLGALDKNLREGMQFEMRRLQRQLGITALLVTHDQEEALTMADRVAVMSQGRIRQIGTPSAIYERPHDRFVAEFLGTANIWTARVERWADGRATVSVLVGHQTTSAEVVADRPCRAGDSVSVALRPEKLLLFAIGRAPAADLEGGVELMVTDRVFRGNSEIVKLREGSSETDILSYLQTALPGPELTFGARVLACWHPGALVMLSDAR